MKFVIARYNEDIDWALQYKHDVVQKDLDMPNQGREPASYLLWIINNYCKLKDDEEYVFCQGNPFDHCPTFLEDVKTTNYFGITHECDLDGYPEHGGLPIKMILDHLKITNPTRLYFKAGVQFKLTGKQIKEVSYEKYAVMFSIFSGDNILCYIYERIPKLIYPCLKI